jgi:hypothetical protein
MQQAPGSGKGKGKGKGTREPRRQRDTHAASGEVTPDNEIEEDDQQEADADTFDPVFYPELREAELREAPSAAAHIARLEAEVRRLTSRLDTRTFETRDRDHITRSGDTRSKWKADSLRLSPADMPLMTKPGSIFGLRSAVFTWLGSYSFVLRLAPAERTMMTEAEHALQRDNRRAFLAAWTQASLTQLQHDVYMGLQRHLGNSILVSPIFTSVTTENDECATYLWDALLQAFHPRSPQVIADFLAEKTVAILRGPDHNAADPSLAFRKWDTAVGALNRHAHDLPPITAQMLCACLMYASLHASKEDSYYQAYMQLQATLALPTAIFDAATVRAAAVSAFHAEQRRLSSTSRAPESVLGFAAAATSFRRPPTGTSTPASNCCRCPHHCVLPDGTFRIVRPAVEAHLAAVPDRGHEDDVSDKTLRAYKAYQVVLSDPDSSSTDIQRATRALKSQRQDDRERARYYRMQEEEDAIMAIAAARDYDSDE